MRTFGQRPERAVRRGAARARTRRARRRGSALAVSAETSAASSTSLPRLTFTSSASRRMAASSAAPIRRRVSRVWGAAMTTTSRRRQELEQAFRRRDRVDAVRRGARRVAADGGHAGAERHQPRAPSRGRLPRGRRSARSSPRWCSSPGGAMKASCDHWRGDWVWNASGSLRNRASVTASTCSAIVSALIPRELVITTGDSIIAGNSMPPTPAAGLCTHCSRRRGREMGRAQLRHEGDVRGRNQLERALVARRRGGTCGAGTRSAGARRSEAGMFQAAKGL